MNRLKREGIVVCLALGAAVIGAETLAFLTGFVSSDKETIAFWRGYGGGAMIAYVICKTSRWSREG